MSSVTGLTTRDDYAYLFKRPSWILKIFQLLFEYYCRTVLTIYCPLTVKGRDNIPSHSYMFCSNHGSHMDTTVLMSSHKLHFDRYSMIAAKDYWFDNKVKKFLSSIILTLIPIDRVRDREDKLSIADTIELTRKILADGNRNLIFYPEGTRSLSGEMGRFKKGAASFAIKLGIPVVPVHINGAHAAWPKGRIFMKPKRISVVIGEPIYSDKYYSGDSATKEETDRAVIAMTGDIEKAIHSLGDNNHG